ncbi:MAG: hypothetical protein ACYDBR_04295 [Gaiellaceae bacterium]
MKRKKTRTPEQRAADEAYRRYIDESSVALWDYLESEWDKLAEQAAREGRTPRFPRPVRPSFP